MKGRDCANENDGMIELAEFRLRRNGEKMIGTEIRALYGYWEALRGERPCPDHKEIDPRDIPVHPRHLFILERVDEDNIRFRLAGTTYDDAFGFHLGGMSVKAIMAGRSRESFVAFVNEALAEPGVGYARFLAPDGVAVWELVLLPLRGCFGEIDRALGCLLPVNGRIPPAGPVPLRFTIESMALQPVLPDGPAADNAPSSGFGEDATPFASPRPFRTIEGGRAGDEGDSGGDTGGERKPALRVIRGSDDED